MSYWQPKSAMSLPQAAHKRGEYRQLIGIQWVEGNLAVAPAGFAEARLVPSRWDRGKAGNGGKFAVL
jgi:hypothetical protein